MTSPHAVAGVEETTPLLLGPDSSVQNNFRKLFKYRVLALFCAVTLAVGSHFAAHTLGTLKSKELGISNSEYGVLQSCVSVVNTIIPVFGGIFIDVFGINAGSGLSTTLIAVGSIFIALSTNLRNFGVMVFGRVIYGLGSGMITVAQEAILSSWFQNTKWLSTVFGVQIACSRLASFLSMAIVTPIVEHTGFYGSAFWFSSGLCVLSSFVSFGYLLLTHSLERDEFPEVIRRCLEKKRFRPEKLGYLPRAYWWIIGISFTLCGAWTTFLHLNTEMIKFIYGNSDVDAAIIASMAQVLPIFIAPCLGYLHDRLGKRVSTMLLAGCLFNVSMLLLYYRTSYPIIAMLLFSLSLTVGPVALTTSIPLLIPKEAIGTGLGLYKSAFWTGTTIYDILMGLLQDHQKNYQGVLIFNVILGSLSLVCVVCLGLSNSYGVVEHNQRPKSSELVRRKTWFPVIMAGVLLLSSWLLFLNFLLQSAHNHRLNG